MSTNSSGTAADARTRITALLGAGLRAHEAGDLDDAARRYQEMLGLDATHPDALNLLGVVALQRGDASRAVELITQATERRPDMAAYFQNLGAAHAAANSAPQAVAAYRRAVALDPTNLAAHTGAAQQLERAGQAAAALSHYQQVVELAPRQVSAHIELGNLYGRLHQPDNAAHHYRIAAELDPTAAEAWNNLGNVCFERRQLDAAMELFGKAIEIRPDFALGHFNRGRALAVLGRGDDAIQAFVESLRLDNNHPEAHRFLGNLYLANGNLPAAADHYREVLRIDPVNVEALNLVGLTQLRAGDLAGASEHFSAALRLDPEHADSLNNFGHVLSMRGDAQAAIRYYEQAIAVRPAFAEAHCNLGNALKACDDLPRAMLHYRRALSLKPDFSAAHLNMGNCLKETGDYSAAYGRFEQAALIDPASAEAHLNKGIVMLALGRFADAWKEYEWRIALLEQGATVRIAHRPQWSGEPLAGRRLLVRAEQGLGDSMQFARYLPMLKALGAQVIFECQPRLTELFRDLAGVDQIVARQEHSVPAVDFDYHVYLLSLPGIFGTTLKSIPDTVPYLRADPARARHWRATIVPGQLNVGLAWAGNPNNSNDKRRSCRLADLAAFADIPGVAFHSLQKGPGAEQAARPPAGMRLIDAADAQESFADTAALVDQLDLVISIDSAVAHLAGAMGKPVWVLLHDVPDWRWMRERPDSPWYPGMRLFRQTAGGDWRAVAATVAAELRAAARSRTVPERYYDAARNTPDLRIGRRYNRHHKTSRPNVLLATARSGDVDFPCLGARNLLREVLGECNTIHVDTGGPRADDAAAADASHPLRNPETVDIAIVASECHWHGAATRPLVQRLLQSTVPTVYLGVGFDAAGPARFEQLDPKDQLMLIRALAVTVNEEATESLLEPLQPRRLPGLALLAGTTATARTGLHRIALSTQGISRRAQRPIEPATLDYTVRLFRELADHYDCGLVCHELAELEELAPLLGDRLEFHYSNDATDYLSIYAGFDLTVTTCLPAAGLCASLGIPGFVIGQPLHNAAATPPYLTERIDPARDTANTVLHRLGAMDIAAASRRIMAYKAQAQAQYVALLATALAEAGFPLRQREGSGTPG